MNADRKIIARTFRNVAEELKKATGAKRQLDLYKQAGLLLLQCNGLDLLPDLPQLRGWCAWLDGGEAPEPAASLVRIPANVFFMIVGNSKVRVQNDAEGIIPIGDTFGGALPAKYPGAFPGRDVSDTIARQRYAQVDACLALADMVETAPTKTKANEPAGYVTWAEAADAAGIQLRGERDAIRKRFERFREKNPDKIRENADAGGNIDKFMYRMADASTILEAFQSSRTLQKKRRT